MLRQVRGANGGGADGAPPIVVGGHDPEVLQLNRLAQRELGGQAALLVVPDATHLLEKPGALDLARVTGTVYSRVMAAHRATAVT